MGNYSEFKCLPNIKCPSFAHILSDRETFRGFLVIKKRLKGNTIDRMMSQMVSREASFEGGERFNINDFSFGKALRCKLQIKQLIMDNRRTKHMKLTSKWGDENVHEQSWTRRHGKLYYKRLECWSHRALSIPGINHYASF